MTDPDKDLLATTEGVDEGSARSTVESTRSAGAPDAASPGAPDDTEAEPAPPLTLDSPQQAGPGQQLEAGEG